ncbi:hypothetical protein ACFLTA_03655 [Bacteroidota bacterium]
MKQFLIIALLILFLPLAGISQLTHVGPEAGFATGVKEPGFGIQAIYRVNDEIKLTPIALYYLPHKVTTTLGWHKYSWFMVNLDGNYMIINQEGLEVYGIMGLNFSNIMAERDELEFGQQFKDKTNLQKLGLNVGAGIRLKIGDKIMPFGELRYTLGSKAKFFTDTEVSTSQFGIFAGILVRISDDKDRTATEDY